MDDWWTILRSGMWRLLFKLSREGKARFYKEFLPLLHDTKERVLGERDAKSYYLVYLGTKPSARGKGYARRLIEHGLAMVRSPLSLLHRLKSPTLNSSDAPQADTDGMPTYLESSAGVNVPYYEKFGFGYIKEVHLQRGEKPISLSIMVREPKTSAGAATESKSKSGGAVVQAPVV